MGRKGITQAVRPAINVLLLKKQNIAVPQSRFIIFPKRTHIRKQPLNRERLSTPKPTRYVMSGKDRINPPVGPVMICQPPVKLEKTGSPKAPNNM